MDRWANFGSSGVIGPLPEPRPLAWGFYHMSEGSQQSCPGATDALQQRRIILIQPPASLQTAVWGTEAALLRLSETPTMHRAQGTRQAGAADMRTRRHLALRGVAGAAVHARVLPRLLYGQPVQRLARQRVEKVVLLVHLGGRLLLRLLLPVLQQKHGRLFCFMFCIL